MSSCQYIRAIKASGILLKQEFAFKVNVSLVTVSPGRGCNIYEKVVGVDL
jgi:hypothetical protein